MKNFNISHFCDKYNKEFKIYYNYLNNPLYAPIIYSYLSILEKPEKKEYIKKLIKINKKIIKENLKLIDYVIIFYKNNKLINKTDIGKFFVYFEKSIYNKNLNNENDLFDLFYELIKYDNIINLLKECFFIFSEYRSCIYFLTPSVNFNIPSPNKKKLLINVINNFNNNLYTLVQIISKVYVGDKNPWGSVYYSVAYGAFDTLIILKKYFKNPLKEIDINFKPINICNKKDIIKNLCKEYQIKKLKNNPLDERINEKNINTVSQFIIVLKRMGYDLWFVIPLVFDTIFKKYKLNYKKNKDLNIDIPLINNLKIYYQKKNIEIGVKIFILVQENFITSINILQNFND
jgi:hypothetical protein